MGRISRGREKASQVKGPTKAWGVESAHAPGKSERLSLPRMYKSSNRGRWVLKGRLGFEYQAVEFGYDSLVWELMENLGEESSVVIVAPEDEWAEDGTGVGRT